MTHWATPIQHIYKKHTHCGPAVSVQSSVCPASLLTACFLHFLFALLRKQKKNSNKCVRTGEYVSMNGKESKRVTDKIKGEWENVHALTLSREALKYKVSFILTFTWIILLITAPLHTIIFMTQYLCVDTGVYLPGM